MCTIPLIAACATLTALALPAAAGEGMEPPIPDDLSGYRHVNSLVINDKDNPLFGFHHFYADAAAMKGLKGRGYADGATFVGTVYGLSDADGPQINEGAGAAYTLMVRDTAAKETGGWRFAQYTAGGKLVEQDEKAKCFQCHTQVADQDYVFTTPLELRLPMP